MFTGLIEGTAEILRSAGGEIVAKYSGADGIAPGDSVSVDGACLTAEEVEGEEIRFHASPETLSRSAAGGYRKGARVNIELPLRADGRLHGHMVTGHVDCVSRVTAVRRDGPDRILGIALDPAWSYLVVEKGSVAVSGISLTVARVFGDSTKRLEPSGSCP